MATQRKITAREVTLEERRASGRFRIRAATAFVIGYLLFILAAVALGGLSLFVTMRGTLADVKDLIITISGIFSGPLGLMIGYFFRTEQEQEHKSAS
jgi:hypothetical protein